LSGWLSPYDMASALAKQYTPGSFKKWDYGRDGSDTSFFIKAKLETFLSDRNILVSVVDHYLQADFLLKMRNQLMSSRKSVTDLLLDNGWFVMNEQVDEFLFLRRQLSSEERTANFIISDRTIREDSLEQLLSLYKQNKKMWLLYRLGNSDLFSPVILVSKEELIQFDHREIPIFPQGAIVNRRDDLVQAGNFSAIGFKYQPEINFFLSRSKGMKFEIEKINSDNTVEIVFKNNGLFLRIYNPLPLSNVQSVQEFSRKEKMVDKLLRLFDVSRNWLIVTQKWEDKINPARASVFQVVLDGLGKEMHVLDVRDVLARVIHLLHQLQSRYYEAHLKQYGGDPSKSFSNPLTIKLSKDEKHITYSFYQTPILDFFYADKKLEEIFEKDIRESDWNQISNYFNEEAIKGIEVRLYQMLLLTDGLRFVHNGQLWSIDNSGNLQPVKTDAAMMNVDDMYERYLFINSAGRIPQMIAAESVGDIFGESYFLRTMLGEIPESTIFDRLNAAIYVIENDGFYDEETQFAKKYLLEVMRGYGAGATNSGRLIAARYLHGHFPDEIDAQAEQLIEQAIRGTLFNISVFDRIMAAVYAYQNNLKIFIDTEEVEIFLTNLYQKANISLHERLIAAIYISEYDFDEGESYDFIFSVLKGEIKATNNDRVLAAIHVGIYGEEEDETYADGFLSAVRGIFQRV